MTLSLVNQEQENRTIISLEGELDVATSPSLRDDLQKLIDNGRRHIVVDMSKVSYMDSSGLSAFIVAHKSLGARGSLSLVGCRPTVERVLRFTQFDKVLALYRSFEDLEAGNRDNLRAVSGVSKSVIEKQRAVTRAIPRRTGHAAEAVGRRLQ